MMSQRSAMKDSPTWPEELRHRYRERGYWEPETFIDFIADRTTRFAERTAVVGWNGRGKEERWSYAELGVKSEVMASHLMKHGIHSGDRVVVALPNIVG